MYTREPALLESLEIVWRLWLLPKGGREEVTVFIESDGVESMTDLLGYFSVDEGIFLDIVLFPWKGNTQSTWLLSVHHLVETI